MESNPNVTSRNPTLRKTPKILLWNTRFWMSCQLHNTTVIVSNSNPRENHIQKLPQCEKREKFYCETLDGMFSQLLKTINNQCAIQGDLRRNPNISKDKSNWIRELNSGNDWSIPGWSTQKEACIKSLYICMLQAICNSQTLLFSYLVVTSLLSPPVVFPAF